MYKKNIRHCKAPSSPPLHPPRPDCSSFSFSPSAASLSSPRPSSFSPPLALLSSSYPWKKPKQSTEKHSVGSPPVVHEFTEFFVIQLVVTGDVKSLESSVHLIHTQFATKLLELLIELVIFWLLRLFVF